MEAIGILGDGWWRLKTSSNSHLLPWIRTWTNCIPTSPTKPLPTHHCSSYHLPPLHIYSLN